MFLSFHLLPVLFDNSGNEILPVVCTLIFGGFVGYGGWYVAEVYPDLCVNAGSMHPLRLSLYTRHSFSAALDRSD